MNQVSKRGNGHHLNWFLLTFSIHLSIFFWSRSSLTWFVWDFIFEIDSRFFWKRRTRKRKIKIVYFSDAKRSERNRLQIAIWKFCHFLISTMLQNHRLIFIMINASNHWNISLIRYGSSIWSVLRIIFLFFMWYKNLYKFPWDSQFLFVET